MRNSALLLSLLIGCTSDQITKTINDAPTVAITSHSDGFEVFEGETVSFRAQASDTNNGTQAITVAWYLGQEVVCDWATPLVAGDSFCEITFDEINTVVVEVRDEEGAAGRDEITGNITANAAPEIEILSPTEVESYYSNQLIYFQVQVSDAEDNPEDLVVEWESSLDGALILESQPDSNGSIDDASYLSEGQHLLEVRITDTMGKSVAQSLVLDVGGENMPPSCEIIAPENHAAYSLGETIFFTGQIQDSEASPEELSVQWISDKDGDLGTGSISSNGEVYLSTSTLSADTHTITFSGVDDVGETCSAIIFLTVGTAPIITLNSPSDGDVFQTDESISFSALVTDDDELSSQLSISWVSDLDGELSTQASDSNGNISFTRNNLSADTHTITLTVEDGSGLTTTNTFSLLVNTPPTAPSITISPSVVQTGDNLLVTATGSTDADGDSINYTYQWYQNGVLSSNATMSVAASLTNKGDIWTTRVTPNDGNHDGSYSEVSVLIENTAPVISNTAITPSSPSSSELLTCSVTASDADGETLTTTYIWSNETTGQTLGSNATFQLSSGTAAANDTIKCTVSVSDADAAVTSSALTTIGNTAPVISSVSILGTPEIGETLSCSVIGADADGDLLSTTYSWLINGQVLGTADSITLNSAWISPTDTIECSATISDPSGDSDSDSSSVQIQNQAPIIASVSLTPSIVNHQGTIECSASVSDPDDETPSIAYSWENLTTGTIIGANASLTLTPSTATSQDVIVCTVTATDGYGGSSSDSASFTVENTAPYFTSVAAITPGSGLTTSSTLSCSGIAQDTDGTLPQTSYSWENLSTGATIGSTSSITLNTTITSPTDVVACTITATDSDGETETSTASVFIENSAPIISSVSITPSAVNSFDTVSCQVTWNDADDEILIPAYLWVNSDSGATLGTSSSLNLDPSVIQPSETLSCTVSFSDNYGASVFDSDSVAISNTSPVISALTITPDSNFPYNDSILDCVITASDADNQTLTEVISWTNQTQGTTIGSNSSLSLDSSLADSYDEIVCQATVTDLSGDSDITSTSVTLANRIPDVPTLSLSPTPAYLDSVLLCTIDSQSDDDNDPLTNFYSWSINGSTLSGQTSDVLSSGFTSGDSVTCEVISSDGTLNSAAGSISVTITNRPPTISSVTLSPNPAYTNNTITATPVASDLDGDSLSFEYTWSVAGIAIQAGSGNSLDTSFYQRDDLVSVSVEAFDQTDFSAPVVESITISNTAPTTPVINISPTIPVEGIDDLVCTVASASTDIDGDSVSYGFSWTVDGSTYSNATNTSLDSTVAGTETLEGDEWICAVTPNDGTDNGSSTDTSVIIDADWAGPLEFTNCGQTGQNGPSQSQCNAEYSGTTLDGFITITSGFQYWIVPSDGTYYIEASGAQGGSGASYTGGLGAQMTGEFILTQGDTIKILVGQLGENLSNYKAGGGGGGSFVTYANNVPLIISGGGGGGGGNSSAQNGQSGLTGTSGGTGSQGSFAGGTNGGGGNANGGSAGGGGLNGNGTDGSCSGDYGRSFINGGAGGAGGTCPAGGGAGGFGGGSGGEWCCQGATGAGGGYSGGGATDSNGVSGGGGSYSVGTNQSNTSQFNTGHGYVIIDKL